ncbi:putative ribonuclease H-like domain-containing protein [Tanacetum coccineum]
MRPFGCLVTILNTLDPLGKFDGKADEGYLVGYSINRKAFRVFNSRTRKVEENLHINFLENEPNVPRSGPEWLFDIDSLTKFMNYEPVTSGNQTNGDKEGYANSTNRDSTASLSVSAAGPSINTASENINTGSPNINTASPIPNDSSMQSLENTGIFDDAYDDREVGVEADLNNLETTMNISPIPTTRIHKDHPIDHIIRDINLATQTRMMTKISKEHAMIEAMQEELLQFKLQKVWTMVDLLKGKRAIRTKWVYRNKKDKRGIVVRNNSRLVAQGYTQEEGINYDEVFAPVARIEVIRLFLAYTSFMRFIMYQIDVKSAFLYGTIEEEVYVCQPPSFEDPQFPNKVYKVEKDLYGLHQAPRAWYETLSTYLLENGFRRGTIDKTLFIKKDRDDAQKIPDEFYGGAYFLLRITTSTPMEPNKALVKDEEAEDVDVHLYRSMIGSLMYLIASRPDITFVVCACARFQVTPKISHLHAVKRIFRYLKGQPNLGLWYPRDSPFDLKAFSDSDYAGASLDRKSTTGVALIEGRMISIDWRCFLDEIKFNTGISKINTARVAYLKKPIGSEGFQEIVDFLNGSHIRYALTKNLTIYVSLIEKFWQTTTVRNVDNKEQEINSTVDGKEFTITEASVRRHLQLADAYGISILPNTKIFDQLTLMGYVLTDDKLTLQKAEEGEGSGNPSEPHPPPSTAQPTHEEPERGDSVERAATTATSLEAVQDSSNIAKTQSMTTPTKPIYQETGLDGGPWRQETLGVPLFKLDMVLALETDFKQTKKVYGTAYTKLIMKVKKLEKTVKTSQARRRAKIPKYLHMQQEFTLIVEEEEQLVLAVVELVLPEDIRARVKADEELTQKLQAEEMDKYSEVDQARMIVDMINQRKRYFAAQKAKAKRNKHMTQAQQRTYMSNYVKHMGSHTLQQLKKLSFDEVKELFEITMKRVNNFTPMESDETVLKVIAKTSKRDAEQERIQEISKRQNI